MEHKIYVQRKRAGDTWVRPSRATGNSEQQYNVFYEGELIGSWGCPECAAARWLITQGKAKRSDRLLTFRRYDDKPDAASLHGSVGWFADHTVNEDGTPRWAKYVPFPSGAVVTGSATEE